MCVCVCVEREKRRETHTQREAPHLCLRVEHELLHLLAQRGVGRGLVLPTLALGVVHRDALELLLELDHL